MNAKNLEKVLKVDSKTGAIEVLSRAAKALRLDGWMNIITGLGVKGKDKRVASKIIWTPMDESTAEDLYSADALAATIVNEPVEECLRTGYDYTGIEKDLREKIKAKKNQLCLHDKLKEAWKMGRTYGGAGLLILTDKVVNLSEPLIPGKEAVTGFNYLTRWELYVEYENLNKDITSERFGEPEYYRFSPRQETKNSYTLIHHSRIVRFDGDFLPRNNYVRNHYWHDSVLNKCYEAIRNYQTSHGSISNVLEDFSVAVFKIKNLADQIASDDDKLIQDRMNIVNMTKSVARMVILDADGEDFDHKTRTLTGVKDLVDKVEDNLVTASRFPHTVLFGESPEGMGGSGRHEETNWYNYLSTQQENYLKPRLLYLTKLICAELNIAWDKLDIEFNSFEQPTEKEVVDLRKAQAETDQIYIQNGVVDPVEIAKSRFGGEKYSSETEIDVALRETMPTQFSNPEPTSEPTMDAAVKSLLMDMIQRKDGKFEVYDSDKNLVGTYDSESKALTRAKEVAGI